MSFTKKYKSTTLLVFIFILIANISYGQLGSRAPMTLADVLDPNYLNNDLREPAETNIKGSQFTNDWMNGNLILNQQRFDDLTLRYNGFTDNIWVRKDERNLVIDKRFVQSFNLIAGGDTIKYVTFNSEFYRELFQSEALTFLAKDKVILEKGEGNTGYNAGRSSDEYIMSTSYYIVNSTSQLEEIQLRKKNLNIFAGEKEQMIKNQLKKENLKINTEEGMIRLFQLLYN